uniref:Uncharacterized protein n=1 Tax=Panagrolaimus superbus TaxID=310955 RepID=A0A914Y965_9BILA
MITINNFTRTFQQSARDNTFLPFGKTSLENTNITVCILNQCFTNFVKSVSAIIDNGVFDVRVNWNLFSKDYSYTLFNGIVDQRNLIFFDGSLFSDNRQCMEYNDIDYLPSLKTCCTSFQPVPQISSPSTKCSNFKAVSSIFDTKTNNLIATNYANFVLSDYYITATWHYVLDPRFSHIFSINDVNCQKAPSGIQYCNYFIGSQNKEFLIQDSFVEEFIGGPNVLIGRIILRNGQTLMEEGIQFSPSNQCQNFNGIAHLQTANVTFKVINQFCCADFDAPTTPSSIPSSTSPTTPPPTKLISQQCNQISTVSIDNNSAKVSTNMQIKSINNDKNEIYISDINIKTSMNISNVSIYVYNFMELVLECQNVVFNSANFTVDNKMIKIVISYLSQSGGLYTMDIFKGIIDQGNFISINGIMYDKNDNKCFKSSSKFFNQ